MSLFHAGLQPALDANGSPISGATWTFYLTGTLTPTAVYANNALTTSLGSSETADAAGRFAVMFLDDDISTRAVLRDAGGTTIKDIDPVDGSAAASGEAANLLAYIPANLRGGIVDRTSADDVSEYVQAAIDDVALAGGGTILVPDGLYNLVGVERKSGVTLRSMASMFGYLATASPLYGVQFKASGAGWILDSPATPVFNCAVEGIAFAGLGAGTSVGGIRDRDVTWGAIKNCSFNNMAEQAILIVDGIATRIEDILTTNVLLDRTRAAVSGAIEADGTDHYFYRIQANPGLATTISDSNLRICSFVLKGAQHFVSDSSFEFGDQGAYISATTSRFTGCRADLNRADGWNVSGGGNMFAACVASGNSQDTTNTYDNWLVTAGNNSFSACQSQNPQVKKTRYGFNDTVSSATIKNYYDASCFASEAATANWKLSDNASSSRQTPMGPFRSFTDGDTTPSVAGYGNWRTANTGATSYTNFDDGIDGQVIELTCLDEFTTLVHNGGQLSLLTSANRKLVNGAAYVFRKHGAVWREIGSRPLKATATVDPASLATGASTSIATVAVTGAALGNMVQASFSLSLAGASLTAWVSATDVVSYFFTNVNGTNPLDLGSGTLTVHVWPQ